MMMPAMTNHLTAPQESTLLFLQASSESDVPPPLPGLTRMQNPRTYMSSTPGAVAVSGRHSPSLLSTASGGTGTTSAAAAAQHLHHNRSLSHDGGNDHLMGNDLLDDDEMSSMPLPVAHLAELVDSCKVALEQELSSAQQALLELQRKRDCAQCKCDEALARLGCVTMAEVIVTSVNHGDGDDSAVSPVDTMATAESARNPFSRAGAAQQSSTNLLPLQLEGALDNHVSPVLYCVFSSC